MTRRADDRGSVLIVALLATIVLGVIGASLMRGTFADLDQGARSQATNRSLQAAEAGVNDYIAKLTQDHLYYAHDVHPAESTRQPASGPLVAKGHPWNGTLVWTYPNGRDGWADLGDGMEYGLQVFPPTDTRTTVRLVATGRRTGDPSTAKTLEALVRTASIADYQMISNTEVQYGSTATTNGKVYANGNIVHNGVANANLLSEGSIYKTKTGTGPSAVYAGTPTYGGTATGYTPATAPDSIRTLIKNPIDFGNFTSSIGDVQRAADSGLLLNEPGVEGYWLDFTALGTIDVRHCTGIDLSARPLPAVTVPATPYSAVPARPAPTCDAVAVAHPVPANGAIYVGPQAIVSGTVKGRVTVATPKEIVIGGDIQYAPGVDVLGLMAQTSVVVPDWAPTNLNWKAATIAMEGQWRSATPQNVSGTVDFTGSTATFGGGYMSQYATRNYNYDVTLLFLQPPYFPVLEDAYTIELLREIP